MYFRDYWINLLHKVATGAKRTRMLLTPIGFMTFGAFTALFVFAAVAVDRLLNLPGLMPNKARLPVSIPLIMVGLAITVWSVFHYY
jgi:hypothetical protein